MSFAIYQTGTGGAPMIVCDQCGEHIRNAGMATCYWKRSDATSNSVLYVVHKGCHHEFDRQQGAATWPTKELRHFMVELADNIGMPPDDWSSAIESAGRLREIG